MVGSPIMAKYQYHVRSTSFPSASHPLTARVDEELKKMRGFLGLSGSSVQTKDMLHDGFCGLISLYEAVEDLFQLPYTQQVLVHHRDEKYVDKVLDGSVRLLDLTSTTRDVLLQMKEYVQETQSSLRRRRGESDFRNEVDVYMLSKKKVNKVVNKCLGNLRKMCSLHSTSQMEKDHNLVAIVSVLREVEAISLSVFEFLFSFMSGLRTPTGLGGWSLVAKYMHSRKIMCEDQQGSDNEIVKADTAMLGLRSHKLCHDHEVVNAQKQLQELEASIGGLEDGLECLFKRLIKTRVSLLNIFSA